MSVSVAVLLGVTPQKKPTITGVPVWLAALPSIVKSLNVILELATAEGVLAIPVTPVDPAASLIVVTPCPCLPILNY